MDVLEVLPDRVGLDRTTVRIGTFGRLHLIIGPKDLGLAVKQINVARLEELANNCQFAGIEDFVLFLVQVLDVLHQDVPDLATAVEEILETSDRGHGI